MQNYAGDITYKKKKRHTPELIYVFFLDAHRCITEVAWISQVLPWGGEKENKKVVGKKGASVTIATGKRKKTSETGMLKC